MHPEPGEAANPELRPLLRFVRRPAFASAPPGRLIVWHWLGWQGLLMLALLLGGVLDQIFLRAFHLPPVRSARLAFIAHPSWAAVAALLAAPALEELGFRAFLSTAAKFVFTGLVFFSAYVYGFIYEDATTRIAFPTSSVAVLARYAHVFWMILPAGVISLLLYRYRRDAVLGFFRHRAGWVFWTSCIVFGAGHSRLYSDGLEWWSFVLVMPQFLAGVGLAYLRTSFGLRWSIAAHYAIDIPFVLLRWLYALAASSALLHGMFVTLLVGILMTMAYGSVVLQRVVRLRW
jgi:Type II CAAX prenyl endopeptidase Rce1-like